MSRPHFASSNWHRSATGSHWGRTKGKAVILCGPPISRKKKRPRSLLLDQRIKQEQPATPTEQAGQKENSDV